MTLPTAKRLLNYVWVVVLTAAAANSAQAGAFFHAGFGSSAGCGTYYTGFAPGFYGVGFRGFGRTSYATFYAPTSGSACNPCGTGACCVAYGGCGICCNSCVACCNVCGLAGCDGCTISCAPAGSDSTGGGSASGPRTFDEDAQDGEFRSPAIPDATGGSGGAYRRQGTGGESDDIDIQRTNRPPSDPVEETIQPRDRRQPADAEPSTEGESESGAEGPPEPPGAGADVPPLNVESGLASGIAPTRTRLHYTVTFRAPHIARVDVSPSPNHRWIPVDTETKLAAGK